MVGLLVKVEGAESPLTDNQPLATQPGFGFRAPRLEGAWKSLFGSRVESLKSPSSNRQHRYKLGEREGMRQVKKKLLGRGKERP